MVAGSIGPAMDDVADSSEIPQFRLGETQKPGLIFYLSYHPFVQNTRCSHLQHTLIHSLRCACATYVCVHTTLTKAILITAVGRRFVYS